MNYTEVIDEFLVPKESLVSVIDSFDAIGKALEVTQRIRERKTIKEEDAHVLLMNSLYTLGFYPFWQAHGAVFRPILLQALYKDGDIVENFFIEAIPTALTIAMPNMQLDYDTIRSKVIAKIRK